MVQGIRSNGNNQLCIARVSDLLQVEQSLTRSRIDKLTKLMLILCVTSECFTRSEGKYSLYRFPTEPKQRAVWIGKEGRDKWKPGKNVCLRSQHFASECLHEQTEHASKLIPGSVPTIFAFTRPTKARSLAAMEKRRMLQSTMTVWQNDLLC